MLCGYLKAMIGYRTLSTSNYKVSTHHEQYPRCSYASCCCFGLQAVSCLTFADGGNVLVSGGEDTLLAAWSLGMCLDQGALVGRGMYGGGQRITALHTW
jgi:hypothetical protein